MTSILVARVARFAGESHFMQRYGTTGDEGSRTWSGSSLTVEQFADLVVSYSYGADFVCVDQTGLGGALVDMLARRGITALTSRRAAVLR